MDESYSNFIHDVIDADLESGAVKKIHTRFPPEPNGYIHIGSAKAIWINWMTANKYNGLFNLRFDDTNPVHEDDEFVNSILEDLDWLGCHPNGGVFYASDYFDQTYELAEQLILDGKAYVDDLSPEEMKLYRGSLTEPGKNSPYRDRTPEENLSLFRRMRDGEFENGTHTLRAKIDMSSPNMNMRDPAIYRILHVPHQRQGDKWCIYPLYDFAHPIQDAIEGITHSLCSIEFENHRPLYDWVINNIKLDRSPMPKQREFARLNVTNTVMSKRYLRQLVETHIVDGWDDPRMPTICGLRRRGYTPSSILTFVETAGVSKTDSMVDIALLEHCIREELNESAIRRIAVLDPVKVTIINYPENKTEYFELPNHPMKPELGTRNVSFSRNLYIERNDFMESPIPKYHRLYPENEVRLMGSYIIKCVGYEKDDSGNITEVFCTADLESGNGNPTDGRKIKGTIHWVNANDCIDSKVMMYDHLFTQENMNNLPEGKGYSDYLNTESVKSMPNAKLENSLSDMIPGVRYQFVRNGYFIRDSHNPSVFNNIVNLKDSFKKK